MMKTETTKVRLNEALLRPATTPLAWQDCQQCGAISVSGQTVCARCQAAARKEMAICARPAVWRRVLAGAIDRALPLPFLAFIFPKWALVVVAYHLLCDSTPERRSVGKWVCRLRVISAGGAARWQTVLRRLGTAATQAAWCQWQFIPVVLVYECAAFAFVWLDAQGRRPEDWLAGTQVITEKAFRQQQNKEKENA
jgi:uncharacterized RDD family membrane protein YckC